VNFRTKNLKKLNNRIAEDSALINTSKKLIEESEKQLRHLLDSIPEIVLVIQDGRLKLTNSWGGGLLNLETDSQYDGGLYKHLSSNSREVFWENIHRSASGEPVPPYEVSLIDSAGAEKIKLVRTSPITFQGNPALLVVMSDITAMKRNEQKLKEFGELTDKENKAKARFISMLSHDLRSPFQGLLGIGSILSEDFEKMDRPKMKEMIRLLNDSLQGQYKLLDDLLTWTRFQNDKSEPVRENLYFHDVVESVFKIFESTAATKSISLINMIPGHVLVNGDRKMLNLVIRNLISNAIKFSYPGDGVVVDYEEKGGLHIITVTDTGIGMPPALYTKMNAGEWGLSKPGTGGEKGSGLGLGMVREIVSRHGGKIELFSEENKGTSVTIILPR